MHAVDLDTWTPERVRVQLCTAIQWARYHAGPTGPAQVRALMPTYSPSLDERFAEGWGWPESADDPLEMPKVRRRLSPREVDQLIDTLHWPSRYVAAGHPQSARILNLWLRCKVYKGNFDKTIERKGQISRAHAYRLRDRALGLIAQGLERDRVPYR